MLYNKLSFARYANFSYGLIIPTLSIQTDHSITWNILNDLGDIVNNLVFFIENIDEFQNIIISIKDFEPIVLSLEYLKIYDLICDKIIYKTNNGFLIKFNPIHLFLPKKLNDEINTTNTCYFLGFPVLSNSDIKPNKINWICISGSNLKNASLKINIMTLDTIERDV